MDEPFLIIEKGPGHIGEFFCIHAVCQRECQFTPFNDLLGVFNAISAGADDLDTFLAEFIDPSLKIS